MKTNKLREIDFWIAENVFSWKRGKTYANGNGEWIVNGGSYPNAPTYDQTPCYTTDPAAAMTVLEKCAENTKDLDCIYLGKVHDEWVVGIDSIKKEEVAETLPLAIAKFARKLFTK